MKRLIIFLFAAASFLFLDAQTPLTEAIDFHVKTIEGEPIYLFPLLDDNNIVVIDFFSTTCGPCQEYAPDFQEAYEEFGENQSNVFFMGINWGDDNDGVHEFDSVFGLTYPTSSGTQGGGNNVYLDYQIQAYPTVIVITPDQQIVEQHIWPPTAENIIDAVLNAGGMYVGVEEQTDYIENISVLPNPVTNHALVNFTMSSSAEMQYKIVDLSGKLLFASQSFLMEAGNNNIKLAVSDFENGLYFVSIIVNGTLAETKPFILAR